MKKKISILLILTMIITLSIPVSARVDPNWINGKYDWYINASSSREYVYGIEYDSKVDGWRLGSRNGKIYSKELYFIFDSSETAYDSDGDSIRGFEILFLNSDGEIEHGFVKNNDVSSSFKKRLSSYCDNMWKLKTRRTIYIDGDKVPSGSTVKLTDLRAKIDDGKVKMEMNEFKTPDGGTMSYSDDHWVDIKFNRGSNFRSSFTLYE